MTKKSSEVSFRDKLDFVDVFTLSMLGHLVREELGRKHHDEKSLDFANIYLHVFSHGCFMTFRPEISKSLAIHMIPRDHNSKVWRLKAHLKMQGEVLQHFGIDSGHKV